jgi:ABC-type transporter Mla maintaining outer membrane lipid asymmetry ATPase subunit MlaF
MTADTPALELTALVKDYKGLRPLRIAALSVARGERVALAGFDRQAAEALISLITGASLPDAGDVRVFGRSTAEIATGDEWLASLDRFGIMTDRAATLDASTFAQNLALSFTLSIDPIPAEVMRKVEALARDVGLPPGALQERPGDAAADRRARAHLARAIALDPAILLMDHPTASLPPDAAVAFAEDMARAAGARGLTVVAVTEDAAFAGRAADRYLKLKGGRGELVPAAWRRWFS